MRALLVTIGGTAAIVVACSSARVGGPDGTSGVTFPAHFAEGDGDGDADAGFGAHDEGGLEATPTSPPGPRALPDPVPLRERRQWEYEIVYDRGKVRVTGVHKQIYPQPVVSERRMGRFAVELWIGRELVERVRFDFPMLGAEEVRQEARRPLAEPPGLAAGATVSRRVRVPHSDRATRAILLDRATGQAWSLPWPPDAPLGPPRAELTPVELTRLRDAGSEAKGVIATEAGAELGTDGS
jgi:hypothetical protein